MELKLEEYTKVTKKFFEKYYNIIGIKQFNFEISYSIVGIKEFSLEKVFG